MIQGIRHIIFDLGGVLLNIDYRLTENAFAALGITGFTEIYSQLRQTPLFDDLETGKISRKDFILSLQEKTGIQLTDEQICTAWNAMLLDLPLKRLQLLQQLRPYYDLVLLSNTNEIHEAAFTKALQENNGIQLGHFFDKIYLSHRIGLRKPDAAVFEKVLADNHFKASETLFIDDSPQHIESAAKLGIQIVFLKKGMTIEKDVFRNPGMRTAHRT